MGRPSAEALLAPFISVFLLAPALALDPPGEPEPTMRTLQEIYDRVEDVDARVEDVRQSVMELEDLRGQISDLREVVESFAIAQGLVLEGWRRSTVTTAGSDTGRFASLVYEPDGLPIVSFSNFIGGAQRILVYKFDGQSWSQIHQVGSRGDYSSMAVRPNGHRLVASGAGQEGQARIYAQLWNGSSWSEEVVQNFSSHGPFDTSSAFAPNGQQLISYYDPVVGRLRVARRLGSNNWSHTTVDDDGDVGRYSSMAVYTDGSIGISYYDVDNGNLKVAFFDSKDSTWSTSLVDSDGDVGRYSSIAIAPGGLLAVSYHRYVPGGTSGAALRYAIQAGGGNWDITTVSATFEEGQHTSLAFGPDGRPAISYHRAHNSTNLWFARLEDAGWRTYLVDQDGDVGKYSSLAFNPAGRPTIAYQNASGGQSLKFAEQVPIGTPP